MGQTFGSYALIAKDSKILLLHRTTSHKVWEFPGGGIEFGESPEDAAVREAKEESGLDVRSEGLLSVNSHVTPQNNHYIFFLYRCTIVGGKESASDEEHDMAGWFTADEMERLPDLALSIKSILPKIKELGF
jgi:8-oxo-dGTP diphosphatase